MKEVFEYPKKGRKVARILEIKLFLQNVGRMPAHLVIYRDGVSESEFKKTLHEEIASIEHAITRVRW